MECCGYRAATPSAFPGLTLTDLTFKVVTDKLVRLSKQNIEEGSAGRIHELMLIIAHPARIIECLEFNPETARSQETNQIDKRLRDMALR